VTPFSRFRS